VRLCLSFVVCFLSLLYLFLSYTTDNSLRLLSIVSCLVCTGVDWLRLDFDRFISVYLSQDRDMYNIIGNTSYCSTQINTVCGVSINHTNDTDI
jgi:hypothetical protein